MLTILIICGKKKMRIVIILIALMLTSCTKYTLHFGKACTPDNREWSYVWFMEKDGTVNVAKENCIKCVIKDTMI